MPTMLPRYDAMPTTGEHRGGVRIWFARIDMVTEPLAARYLELLAPHERVQQQRFMFEKDRRRYLVTRALVRDVLARCTGRSPHALRFGAGEHGKPRLLDQDPLRPGIDFNLSHTGDLVMLAVGHGRRLGIDVESMGRAAPLDIAGRYFAPCEAKAMQRLPLHLQPDRFWALWTLKESYVKAYGMGLSIPLDGFHFDLDSAPGRVMLGFGSRWRDGAERWRVVLFRPTERHQAALCMEAFSDDEAPVAVRLMEAVPLMGERAVAGAVQACSPALAHGPCRAWTPGGGNTA